MTYRPRYFIWTLLLFFIEVLIAVFVDDLIIRPYVGDLLVVILIYCFVRSFFRVSVLQAAIATLIFSYLVEFLQYLHLIKALGLQHSKIARVVLGSHFAWIDIVAYTVGVGVVLFVEKRYSVRVAKGELK